MTDIIRILQLGLSGLVFLLAAMNYRLLTQAAKSSTPSTRRSIASFMWLSVVLAVLAAAAPIVQAMIFEKPRTRLVPCRTSIERLSTHSRLASSDLPSLRNLVAMTASVCSEAMEELDVR